MTNTPKPPKPQPTFHINQVGNLNTGDVAIQGDQIGIQTNNANTEELLNLITTLCQTTANFPTETKAEIESDLEDLEAEIIKPESDRNPIKIRKRLIAIATAASLLASGIAGATDFTNTAIDLGQKLNIDVPALVGR